MCWSFLSLYMCSCFNGTINDGLNKVFLLVLTPDTIEDDISNYPQGLVLVPRGTDDDNSIVVGPHIRGSRLRASSAGDEEVDLLLPGTAR